jgi:hypothetical protein
VTLHLVVLFAILGCGNSSDVYVYTGAPQGQAVSGANEVLLSVTVPGTVSGAKPLGVVDAGITVKTLAATEQPISGDYTLPGALCRAYDVLGQSTATVVVSSEGTVRFDTLPSGVYRFVVTNQDAAVLLEVIASASVSGPTVVDANTSSTAAVLVTLAAGKGTYDLKTYSHALAVDLSELIGLVEMQVANPNDPWITPDGKTVVDPAVKSAVEAAVQSLPGKGKFVRDEAAPEGYGEAAPDPSGGNAGAPVGNSNPSLPPQDGLDAPVQEASGVQNAPDDLTGDNQSAASNDASEPRLDEGGANQDAAPYDDLPAEEDGQSLPATEPANRALPSNSSTTTTNG